MRKKFAINLLFLFAVNLLVKPFWIFGIDRVVQNQVGAQVYGTYFAVFNYSFILSIFLDFGINNFNNRAVSRNNKRAGDYLVNLMLLKGILSLLYFITTLATAIATGFSELQMKMLFFLALNQIFLSAILYFRSNIAALQLFKTDTIISILDRFFSIAFCLMLLYSSHFRDSFNIMWFIYAQTLSLFLTSIVAFGVVFRKTVLKLSNANFRFTRLILLKSLPFATLGLLMGIYYRIDAVMIERLLANGAQEAGVYAASFRLLDALNMFGYLFATLLLPMFSSMIRKGENLNNLVKFSSEMMFVMAVIAGTHCYFFRHEIMHLLYVDSTVYWAKIFGWLMLTFIPMSSIYIFGTLLTARGSLKVLNLIALGGVFINITLNLFFIPKWAALGATLATLITQLIVAAIHLIAANRIFGFKYNMRDIFGLVGFIATVPIVLHFISLSSLPWILNLSISLAISLIVASVMRFIPLNTIISIAKSKVT